MLGQMQQSSQEDDGERSQVNARACMPASMIACRLRGELMMVWSLG